MEARDLQVQAGTRVVVDEAVSREHDKLCWCTMTKQDFHLKTFKTFIPAGRTCRRSAQRRTEADENLLEDLEL